MSTSRPNKEVTSTHTHPTLPIRYAYYLTMISNKLQVAFFRPQGSWAVRGRREGSLFRIENVDQNLKEVFQNLKYIDRLA